MFKNFLTKFFSPSFDWIQIEVSGRCNAKCFYCPHTVYREKWLGKNLSLEEFKSLLPFFKHTKLVYLQGWGEPLCNPDIFKMIELAKSQGTQVGFTSNGNLLTEKAIENLLNLDLDYLALSLTGIKTNDILRNGTSVQKIFSIIDLINHAKKMLKKSKPKVHIAYMLLKSNEHELDEMVEIFSKKEVDEIVVSFLDFIPIKKLKDETFNFSKENELQKFEEKLKNLTKTAQKRGLKLVFNFPHPKNVRKICSENPIKSLFVNSLGYVSPCVFTGIPADVSTNLYFGNINKENLLAIWTKREYHEFRKKHASANKPFPCDRCLKMKIVEIF